MDASCGHVLLHQNAGNQESAQDKEYWSFHNLGDIFLAKKGDALHLVVCPGMGGRYRTIYWRRCAFVLSKRTKRGKVSRRSRSCWVCIGAVYHVGSQMAARWTVGS